jgi:hypothetical protein
VVPMGGAIVWASLVPGKYWVSNRIRAEICQGRNRGVVTRQPNSIYADRVLSFWIVARVQLKCWRPL